MSSLKRIVIASRESALALAQSQMIATKLQTMGIAQEVSILPMTTRGDQIVDRPLAQIGGKGLFIKELEVALQQGRADIAVHSMKDMPMQLAEGFAMMVVGEREDARDAFVSNDYTSLAGLPSGARVGTSSLRRECQLRLRYPHLDIRSLRGNVNTRLRKLDEGEYEAIILAAAGLKRLGLEKRIRAFLALADSLPAVGQGALAIEYLSNRTDLSAHLEPLGNMATTACVVAERAFGAALQGSCDIPLAGYAQMESAQLTISGLVGMPDGSSHVKATLSGSPADAARLGRALGEKLLALGADRILAALQAP